MLINIDWQTDRLNLLEAFLQLFFTNAIITFHVGIKSNIIGGGGDGGDGRGRRRSRLLFNIQNNRDILLESTPGMQTQATRSAGEPDFVRWGLVFVDPPYETCFMSFFWDKEFWGYFFF